LAQYIHAILIQSPQIKVSFIGCGHYKSPGKLLDLVAKSLYGLRLLD